MNPYRKLLVLGVNELLQRDLISLQWDGQWKKEYGYIEAPIAGHNSIIRWNDMSCGEISVAVWWKYDHSKHPQANSKWGYRESFQCLAPIAKRYLYKNFVGVVCSGLLEREAGRHLQGRQKQNVRAIYTRQGELPQLKRLANPRPRGYQAEGKAYDL